MIPPNPKGNRTRQRVMQAALPSSASMLADLRAALINQVTAVKQEASQRLFTAKELESLKTLVSTVQLLDANTARVADDVSEMVADMSPAELEAMTAQAEKLLGVGNGPAPSGPSGPNDEPTQGGDDDGP